MNKAWLKEKKDGKDGHVKFGPKLYGELVDSFNDIQRKSPRKLFMNREIVKSMKERVKES